MSIVTSLLSAFFPPRCEAISDLIPGRQALVRGTVVARDFIDSTLTGERCVYYRYAVEQWRNSHVAGLAFAAEGYWAPTRFDEAIVEFYLQDQSGARIIIAPQNTLVERGPAVCPQDVDMNIMGERASELRIGPGDTLQVQGSVASVSDLFDQDRDYRGNASRLMLHARGHEPLRIRFISRSEC